MNTTGRTPTAEPNPDSAPPRPTFRPDLISRILSGDTVGVRPFNTPKAPARPARLHWNDVVGLGMLSGRGITPPTRQIIDDWYPVRKRARGGTRSQRRLAATRAVQRARRKRTALRRFLAKYLQGAIARRLGEMRAAAVPSGPYDPPPVLSPGYTATCGVTYV